MVIVMIAAAFLPYCLARRGFALEIASKALIRIVLVAPRMNIISGLFVGSGKNERLLAWRCAIIASRLTLNSNDGGKKRIVRFKQIISDKSVCGPL